MNEQNLDVASRITKARRTVEDLESRLKQARVLLRDLRENSWQELPLPTEPDESRGGILIMRSGFTVAVLKHGVCSLGEGVRGIKLGWRVDSEEPAPEYTPTDGDKWRWVMGDYE